MKYPHVDDALVQRMLDAVCAWNLEDDYWERQGAMTVLMNWCGDAGLDTAQRWLNRAVATQTTAGWLAYGATTNLAFGAFRTMDTAIMRSFERTASVAAYFSAPLGLLFEKTGDQTYLNAATRQLEAVLEGPRTSEGFLRMNGSAPEVWIDEVYPVCGALAKVGRITGRDDWADEAYAHLMMCAQRLLDPGTGLARHIWSERPNSFPESTFWLRGNGWLICAAGEVLAEAPDHPRAAEVRSMLRQLLEAMSRAQDASGFFHDFIDDTTTPLEASGTLMYAYAVGQANELGLADEALLDSALRGLDAVAAIVAPDCSIGRTVVPPGGPGVPMGSMPLSQSFFLLAAYHLRDTLGLRLGTAPAT
ncbi:MAG: glycoside hydrolase family 88 protein [Nostocoides sp.]